MSKQSEALETAAQIELAVTCGFIGSAEQYDHLLLSAVSHLRRLHARVEELESVAADHIEQDRKMVAAQKTNGLLARIEKEISSAQINNHRMAAPFGKMEGEPCVRISSLLATIEGFLNEATDEQAAEQDPFGYFKQDTYGWMDCSKDTDGAIALYEKPQPQADARDAGRYLDYLIRNQARVCNNLDEYEGEEEDADCGYWLEFTDSNSQIWVQIGVFKTPRDAIDAAIAANKEQAK